MDRYYVDIEEVLDDLQSEWVKSPQYKYNPTAFTKRKIGYSNINMCCPYHKETKPSFGISTEYPYLFNCFSCGASGELITLIADIFQINYLKAYAKIINNYATANLSFSAPENNSQEGGVTEEEIFNYRKKKHSYIETRGISDYTLQKYEIGYDEKNHSIVFPVRDLHGNPLFVIRRDVNTKFYQIPKGAPKHKTLYGLNYLYGKVKEVFIVEGAIDVLSCYEAKLPAVGLMGRTLSKNQLKLLQLAGITKVMLFLDNDEWGVKGNLDAYKIISKTPIRVDVVKYPIQWGIDTVDKTMFKDPNDLLLGGKLNDITMVPYMNYYYDLISSKFYRRDFYERNKKNFQ